MPPRIRGTLSKGLSRLGDGGAGAAAAGGGVFFCPSCATWRRTLSTRPHAGNNGISRRRKESHLTTALQSDGRRPASVLATSAAVNVNRNIPARFRELYEALDEVREAVPDQISLSRFQLAKRGLESEEPVIRVAVLSLNDVSATRRLVRLLLADPLNAREPWEDLLDSYGTDGSPGLLIRYGEESGVIQNNLLPTISVPSTLLKKGNIEILVSTLGAGTEPAGARITEESVLVPTITIPTSHTGRHNAIRYPVHRSIVCGTGVDGLLAYSRLISLASPQRGERSIHGAIELNIEGEKQKAHSKVTFVDTRQADEALAKFRESVQNASDYERGWTASGVQPLVDWLATTKNKEGLDQDLETLIQSLLDAAEEGVIAKEAQHLREQEATSISEEVRQRLDRTVSVWAERAHTELQNSLEEGFASKPWRGLAWWKLFWRVDDVGMITSEILEKRYLCQAEKELIWTAGQVKQAGLLNEPVDSDLPEPSRATDNTDSGTVPMKAEQPWPMQVATSRFQLSNTTVPSLQALSQGLVFFSLSTTALTSALSALLYASSSTSMYEACTVAAVGLIYSLRRQQKKWETARTFWEKEVRETGRKALIETEHLLRTLIRDGGRGRMEDLTETRARAAIERARKALEAAKHR
ncbi:hypothetical protein VTN77DRAFT_2770 [Rasamsonia byssochlamydoides]|uniref:uncharacterized protein n=1 Tax=Rasamsonia byssochlamydoides TaxID=89139 RepID=UPI003743F135